MEVHVDIENDESGELIRSLHEWLRGDHDLHGVKVRTVQSGTAPGEMSGGGVAAGLVASLLEPSVLQALAAAVGGWIAARASTRRIRIRVKVRDAEVETEVEIDTDTVRTANKCEPIVQRLRKELSKAP